MTSKVMNAANNIKTIKRLIESGTGYDLLFMTEEIKFYEK